jgi:hypothetical protein
MPVYLVMFIKADNPQVDDTEYLFWYILQHQIFSNVFNYDRDQVPVITEWELSNKQIKKP